MTIEPIIQVENLSKSFKLYAKKSDRLREVLFPWRKYHTDFHALTKVSFKVFKGEHVGILGVNGAGKSTLLQILTGVLTPSAGCVTVNGRVAALLELGTGFNPELTGRQNVIFQMQLAGFSSGQLKAKLIEVEKFAEVGEFFDQPTKLYSSGMFARVAFSSAILTEPEILIVDEALAVGDARFQKKCMDRMRRMRENGVTVILVSHDIYGTKALSTKMILLDQGQIVCAGEPDTVAAEYMRRLFPQVEMESPGEAVVTIEDQDDRPVSERTERDEYTLCIDSAEINRLGARIWGMGGASLRSIRCKGLSEPNFFTPGKRCSIEMVFDLNREKIARIIAEKNLKPELRVGIRFDLSNSTPLCALPGAENPVCLPFSDYGPVSYSIWSDVSFVLPELAPGDYFLSPSIVAGQYQGEKYVPLVVCDNVLLLRCAQSRYVHGILDVAGDLSMVEL